MEVPLKLAGLMVMLVAAAVAVNGDGDVPKTPPTAVRVKNGIKYCTKWDCVSEAGSRFCCNLTISDIFDVYQFEELFQRRNTPVAHAVDFWDYRSFILAASTYSPKGFCTTGGKKQQMLELAAFLGHVGSQTSCGYGVATGGPLAWGLCYNKEMSPSQDYCEKSLVHPCAPGASYYGRGAIPVYWNYNYGSLSEELKVDILNHPEYLEQNATLAFQAAMARWMTPPMTGQTTAHKIFNGLWKPTRNDTLEKRTPGFGSTMNILYGDQMCGKGDDDSMNNVISHYLHYLDLLGVGREEAGPHENLTCAEQKPFRAPSSRTSS